MTRIIAGSARGRRLATPPGSGTRPTSDRVREALFSRLEHFGVVQDAVVLDLYAGSGALGLEAVSRGARQAVLVESNRRAAQVAGRNLRELGWAERVSVRAQSVEQALAELAGTLAADLVLLDPPYDIAEDTLARVLAGAAPLLAPRGILAVERSSRSPQPTWPPGIEALEPRAYGETTVWFAEPTPG